MRHLALALLIVMAAATAAFAQWQLYKDDGSTIASFDLATFAPFQGNPSVWVRWQYASPRNGVAGAKMQFMADCAEHKLYEIAENPYDAEGNYLASKSYDSAPKEFPVTPGSLNEATYMLLCR
jgi:hypothetical protein